MKALPKKIFVAQMDDVEEEDLLAYRSLDAADDGKVYVYEQVEVLTKRTASEVRRGGSKTWAKF